jgi:hypothetical protein
MKALHERRRGHGTPSLCQTATRGDENDTTDAWKLRTSRSTPHAASCALVMPSFLVEAYAAESIVEDQRRRARRAADLVPGIRYVRTTFLPGDETLLHLFEATSAEALREAACDAALEYERIVEAVEGSVRDRRV